MRTLKLVLIVLLVVVGALYGITVAGDMLSDSDVPPQIQCPAETLEVSVSAEESALLEGVTASDRQDGDLTAAVRIRGVSKLVTNDTAKVSYIVFDSDGNGATCSRMIRYTDYEKPHFELSEPLTYVQDEQIQLLDRLKAVDVLEGDISESIRVSTLASTSDPEVRTVVVQVTNAMGDTARVTLPVVVYGSREERPKAVLKEYLVYLSQGDSFDADSYLLAVDTPTGTTRRGDIQISGTVNTAEPGTYYVYYRYPYNYTVGTTVLTVVVE